MTNKSMGAKQTYSEQLEGLLDSADLKKFTEDSFLFMTRQKVTSYLSRLKLFEKIIGVKGSVVECGVHKGGSLMLYFHLSCILEPYGFNRKIYGFDTFDGFMSVSTEEDEDIFSREVFSDADHETLTRAIAVQDLNRTVPHIPKCELICGDAVKTIPEFKEQHPELIIALLYLDFDIYEPTRVALEHFLPLVPKGGIVAFDELNAKKYKGETKAMSQILNINDIRLEKFYFDPWSSYFIMGS